MSKSAKNNKGGSSEEVKKALKSQKYDRISSSKGVETSTGTTRVGRTSKTKIKKPRKNLKKDLKKYIIEISDDEWYEDWRNFLMSRGWGNDQEE